MLQIFALVLGLFVKDTENLNNDLEDIVYLVVGEKAVKKKKKKKNHKS